MERDKLRCMWRRFLQGDERGEKGDDIRGDEGLVGVKKLGKMLRRTSGRWRRMELQEENEE